MASSCVRWPRHPRPPRPDRANWHAESHHIDALRWAPALSSLGGIDADELAELRERIDNARKTVKLRTSIKTCERFLSWLAALNRAGSRGWRGVIAPAKAIADSLEQTTGQSFSGSTVRNCVSILEAAELIDRGLAERGRPIKIATGRKVARMILVVTLRPETTKIWSTPIKSTGSRWKKRPLLNFNNQDHKDKVPPSGGTGTRVRVTDRTIERDSRQKQIPDSGLARARNRHRELRSGLIPRSSLSEGPQTTSRDDGGTGPPGDTSDGGVRRSVERVISGKPRPDEPRTRRIGLRALLYDCESELIRRRAGPDAVRTVLARIWREADPGWRGRTSQDWDGWIWPWREMGTDDRRRIVSRCILPSVAGSLRRKEIYELPGEPTYTPITTCAGESGQLKITAGALLRLAMGARREPGPRAPTRSTLHLQQPAEPEIKPGELSPEWAAMLERVMGRYGSGGEI